MYEKREAIIQAYVAAYNAFDVESMVAHFSPDIVFQNVSNGTITLELEGIDAFREQAERATALFSERKQTVLSFHHSDVETEICVAYEAVLTQDLPNGWQRGQRIELQGISLFEFDGERIVGLMDEA